MIIGLQWLVALQLYLKINLKVLKEIFYNFLKAENEYNLNNYTFILFVKDG